MDIKAPDLGVESAEVSEIMVAVGDVIAKDDNIILLESDKASVEVPSSAAGKVSKISVDVGDQVSEGMVLIEVDSDADSGADDESDDSSKNEQKQSEADTDNSKSTEVAATNNDKAEQTKDKSDISEPEESTGRATTYALPDLGVEEAQVAEIMVSVGDNVTADDSILLIESDKASVEVPAPETGTIEKILVQAGDMVANGQDFIVIVGSSADNTNSSDGSTADNQTSKKDSEAKQSANESASSKQQTTGEPKQAAAPSASKSTTTDSQTKSSGDKLTEAQVNEKLTEVYAGPAVRKLARQLGVDITQVSGSALNDRILKEDLFAHVKKSLTTQKAATTSGSVERGSLPSLPDMSNKEIWGETEIEDLSRLQKVSIPQLNYNTYLPQVTQFDLSDITETEKLRGELKGGMKAEGIGFTILAFVVKATAHALTQHPRFNSHLSDDNTQIIVRKSVNMGIAVATDDGLIVPVIKTFKTKVSNKSLSRLASWQVRLVIRSLALKTCKARALRFRAKGT